MRVGDKAYINKKAFPDNLFGLEYKISDVDYVIIIEYSTKRIYPYHAIVYFTDGRKIPSMLFREEELISHAYIKKKEFNEMLKKI